MPAEDGARGSEAQEEAQVEVAPGGSSSGEAVAAAGFDGVAVATAAAAAPTARHAELVAQLSQALSVFSVLCAASAGVSTCALITVVRQRIRYHGQIPPHTPCGPCEDCCCAFCCTPCTSAQIFRQLRIGGNPSYETKYSLCSETGEVNPALLAGQAGQP